MTDRLVDSNVQNAQATDYTKMHRVQVTVASLDAQEDRRRAAQERRRARALARGEQINEDDFL